MLLSIPALLRPGLVRTLDGPCLSGSFGGEVVMKVSDSFLASDFGWKVSLFLFGGTICLRSIDSVWMFFQ
jgi:hypothetical protein